MNFSDLKLAAYLDEAGDSPGDACQTLVNLGISKVCLRTAWTRDISRMDDHALEILKDLLTAHGLQPVLLYSTVGDGPISNIVDQYCDAKRAIMVCEALGCRSVRFSLGRAVKSDHNLRILARWMTTLSNDCLSANIRPVLNLDMNSCITQPAEIAKVLSEQKRWGILYDPVDIIATRRALPFVKYWALIKNRVEFIDLHDYHIASGPRPLGHGDAQVDLTLNDAILSQFRGWYCLEPGLGTRYDTIVGRDKLLRLQHDALKATFDRMGIVGENQASTHFQYGRADRK